MSASALYSICAWFIFSVSVLVLIFDLLLTQLYHVVNCRQGTRVIKLADGKELSEGNCSCYHTGTATASVEHYQRCFCQYFISCATFGAVS